MGREGFRSLKDELRLMTNANPPIIEEDDGGPRLGWKGLIFAAVFYVGCVAVATYPLVTTFATTLPGSLLDPLQHLWIMRWYKTCLLEGRSPTLCPNLQYPVGAAFGSFFISAFAPVRSLRWRTSTTCSRGEGVTSR